MDSMKPFSMSLGPVKRPSADVKVHEDDAPEHRQALTSFSGAIDAPKKKKAKVIAALPNSLTSKGKKTVDPKSVGELKDKFEAAIQPKAAEGQYGLVEQLPAIEDNRQHAEKMTSKTDISDEDKLLLPDAPSEEAYDRMPVADFGKALLLGMGYDKEVRVPTIEYMSRPSRMGLGAKPGDVVGGKRSYKELVRADGSVKSIKREGDQLIDTATLGTRKGKTMLVKEGQHKGLECIVREVDSDEQSSRVKVRLLPSEQDVTLSCDVLTEPGASDYARVKSTAPQSKNAKSDERRNDRKSTKHDQQHEKHKSGHSRKESRKETWMLENIRVRVVSKSRSGGKLYLKKGVVMCIGTPGLCNVRMDDTGKIVEGLKYSQVETVVPKAKGTPVVVLRGEHAARHARLLEKRSTAAAVQLTDNLEIVTAVLDDLAEYVGDVEGEDF